MSPLEHLHAACSGVIVNGRSSSVSQWGEGGTPGVAAPAQVSVHCPQWSLCRQGASAKGLCAHSSPGVHLPLKITPNGSEKGAAREEMAGGDVTAMHHFPLQGQPGTEPEPGLGMGLGPSFPAAQPFPFLPEVTL